MQLFLDPFCWVGYKDPSSPMEKNTICQAFLLLTGGRGTLMDVAMYWVCSSHLDFDALVIVEELVCRCVWGQIRV